MTAKEQFVYDVIQRWKAKSTANYVKSLDPFTIAVIFAILEMALKLIVQSKCLIRLFPTYTVNKYLKLACRKLEKEYGTTEDLYETHCDDSLTQAIIEVKQKLTDVEVKQIIDAIPLN